MNTALIFGVTGQDGSYLAELLLSKGYLVYGVSRRTSTANDERIRHLYANPAFKVLSGDVTDLASVMDCVNQADARSRYIDYDDVDENYVCEIYNLAAQSHVRVSFDQPSLTTDVTYKGALNILEAIRLRFHSHIRFYQASSSEMFGSAYSLRWTEHGVRHYDLHHTPLNSGGLEADTAFQDEHTPMIPQSPYAIAKLAAHNLVRLYRRSYGIHASSGILFNHESERRGETFVTRKISKYVAQVANARRHGQLLSPLALGNLTARRDWGHAEDFVRGMWLMLQQDSPGDYVLATGETHSVYEFLVAAFGVIGITNIQSFTVEDPELFRPAEVPLLHGCADKAKKTLGWKPSIKFAELVKRMVLSDISLMYGSRLADEITKPSQVYLDMASDR